MCIKKVEKKKEIKIVLNRVDAEIELLLIGRLQLECSFLDKRVTYVTPIKYWLIPQVNSKPINTLFFFSFLHS